MQGRVAHVPVTFSTQDEGGPVPALSLPKGPSLLGTGDRTRASAPSF